MQLPRSSVCTASRSAAMAAALGVDCGAGPCRGAVNRRPWPNRSPTRSRIALAQLNPTVGDLAGNAAKLRNARADAAPARGRPRLFPELFLAGYPPEDLVLKPAFQEACRAACEALARETADGGPGRAGRPALGGGRQALQRHALLDGGAIEAVRFKVDLPNYGVFDEKRVFDAGPMPGPINFRGVRIGVPICEDIWTDDGRASACRRRAREILLVPNGSPYWRDKPDMRLNVAVARVTETGLPLLYLNQVGGQDELVFDGASFVLNADASLGRPAAGLRGGRARHGLAARGDGWRCDDGPRRCWSRRATRPTTAPACWACATTSTRTASRASCWACRAASIRRSARPWRSMRWAPDRVHCVMLPYRYTSQESLDDADGLRQGAGRALRHRADRPGGRGLRGAARAAVRRAGPRTSPRRTSRAACAARS